jgi:hypothetical protein
MQIKLKTITDRRSLGDDAVILMISGDAAKHV